MLLCFSVDTLAGAKLHARSAADVALSFLVRRFGGTIFHDECLHGYPPASYIPSAELQLGVMKVCRAWTAQHQQASPRIRSQRVCGRPATFHYISAATMRVLGMIMKKDK